jgi:hypothetical protein
MRLTFKHLSALSYLHYARAFLDAAGAWFPAGSRMQRAGAAGAQIVSGLDSLTGLALRHIKDGCNSYSDPLLRRGVERYGRLVTRVNDGGWAGAATDVYEIDGHLVYWSLNTTDRSEVCSEASLETIGAAVFSAALAEIGTDTRAVMLRDRLAADPDGAPPCMTESVAALCAQLRTELTQRHRSILLYGPSGAGKTAASRQLVAELSTSTLVVTSDALHDHTFALLCSWRPNAVILDDIDRGIETIGEAKMLGGIRRLRAEVPLLIATANTREEFSGALLRPGTFDREVAMTVIDPAIAASMLPDIPAHLRFRAVDAGLLPAYLDELNFRVRCGDAFDSTLAEMVERQARAGDGMHRVGAAKGQASRQAGSGESPVHVLTG